MRSACLLVQPTRCCLYPPFRDFISLTVCPSPGDEKDGTSEKKTAIICSYLFYVLVKFASKVAAIFQKQSRGVSTSPIRYPPDVLATPQGTGGEVWNPFLAVDASNSQVGHQQTTTGACWDRSFTPRRHGDQEKLGAEPIKNWWYFFEKHR